MKRLDQLSEPLQALGHDSNDKIKDLRPYLDSSEEAQFVEDLIKVLSPFHNATVKLSAGKVPTLSLVYPTMKKLENLLSFDASDDVAPAIVNLRKTILKDLDGRTKPFMKRYKLAACLDPYTKAKIFMDDPSMEDDLVLS